MSKKKPKPEPAPKRRLVFRPLVPSKPDPPPEQGVRIETLTSKFGVKSYDLYVNGEFVANYRLLKDARRVGQERLNSQAESDRQMSEDLTLEFDEPSSNLPATEEFCECGGSNYEESSDEFGREVCRQCGLPPPPSSSSSKLPPGSSRDEVRRMNEEAHEVIARQASSSPILPQGKPSGLADRLRKAQTESEARGKVAKGTPHVIVIARAGTGKTTTLVSALQVLKGLPPTDAKGNPITPSPQQRAVWDAIGLSKGARSVGFVAFNRGIAKELKTRVPPGCDASTMHGMGFKAVNKAFTLKKGEHAVSEWRTHDLIAEILCEDIAWIREQRPVVLKATTELVALVKQNLIPLDVIDDGDEEHVRRLLQELVDHYEVQLTDDTVSFSEQRGTSFGHRGGGEDHSAEVFDLVPKVITRSRDVAKDGYIDYDDMIWLPCVLNLPMFVYDLLLVDEAQDLNRCQQSLARKTGRRLVLCGDPKQAIYGFAGADADSIPRMQKELGDTAQGCITLPLTVTRRCGKAIVEEARKIVPDFEAHESNPEGRVSRASYNDINGPVTLTPEMAEQLLAGHPPCYRYQVQDGDFILCRVNAPLVSQCFRFIREGRRATILGRDIGKGLIQFVRKLSGKDDTMPVLDLAVRLDRWLQQEEAKERVKRHPNENRIVGLYDKRDCVMAFTEGVGMVRMVIETIQRVFSSGKVCPQCRQEPGNDQAVECPRCKVKLVEVGGIRLASIHKSKGLEARRVFFLMPDGAQCPHPMAKAPWQREQEMNLLYVGITRAIEELVWVR
jgi:DNA helicase-2/ATP-dependent DNA helicase PcrA